MRATAQNASSFGPTAIPYSALTASGLKPVAAYFGTPAGGGYSTVDDLSAFARAIQTRRVLDAEHTDLLVAGKVDTGNGFYSLGLSVRSRNGELCYEHGGSASGVSGDLAIYPRSGYLTVVVCKRVPAGAQCFGLHRISPSRPVQIASDCLKNGRSV